MAALSLPSLWSATQLQCSLLHAWSWQPTCLRLLVGSQDNYDIATEVATTQCPKCQKWFAPGAGIFNHYNTCGSTVRGKHRTCSKANGSQAEGSQAEADAQEFYRICMRQRVTTVCAGLRFPSGGHPVADHALSTVKNEWQQNIAPVLGEEITRRIVASPSVAQDQNALAQLVGEVLQLFNGIETKAKELSCLKNELPFIQPVRRELGRSTVYTTDGNGFKFSSKITVHYTWDLPVTPAHTTTHPPC